MARAAAPVEIAVRSSLGVRVEMETRAIGDTIDSRLPTTQNYL